MNPRALLKISAVLAACAAASRWFGKNSMPSGTKTTFRIILADDGFALGGGKEEVTVDFWDVRMIRAQKIDLWGFDEIRVVFECEMTGPVEVSEGWPGFRELMARVSSRFVGADPDWFSKVAYPAFAPCPTVIWRNDAGQAS